MKALIRGFDVRYKNLREAFLLITIDKRALADLPDMEKPTELTIKPKRKKRSLSANAYCWVLCGAIARKIGDGMRDIDVYREAIRNAADDTMWIPARVPRARAKELAESWEANGIGWLAVPISNAYAPFVEFRLYKGSSVYDSRQMGRLIDELREEEKNLGMTFEDEIEDTVVYDGFSRKVKDKDKVIERWKETSQSIRPFD